MGTASTAVPERARWPRLRRFGLVDEFLLAHLIRDFRQFTGTTPTRFQARTLPTHGDGEREANSVQDAVATGS
jgi:hypothetical protein